MTAPTAPPLAVRCAHDASRVAASRSLSGTDPAHPADPAQRRRAPRVRTLLRATVACEGEPGHEAIVRDVSPGGMCIASRAVSVEEGDLITVALPGAGDLEARVRWCGDGEFGVQITSGLNPLLLAPARARSPRPAPQLATPGAVRRWLGGWRDAFGGASHDASATDDAKPA